MLIVPSATRADLAVPPAELPQPPSYTEVTERPAERGSPAPSGARGHPLTLGRHPSLCASLFRSWSPLKCSQALRTSLRAAPGPLSVPEATRSRCPDQGLQRPPLTALWAGACW